MTIICMSLAAAACGDDVVPSGAPDTDARGGNTVNVGQEELVVPDNYVFVNDSGESTVSYAGQIFRHVLMGDIKVHLAKLTDRIDAGDLIPSQGDVVSELNFFFEFDGDTSGDIAHLIETNPEPKHQTYGDIAGGKDLVGKIAGNDETGQHQDWNHALVGWSAEGVRTPETLVRHWFEQIEALAISRANGTLATRPDGQVISKVFVNAAGVDFQQLVQKFLLGAVAFSQGADDYLDDDTEGKGLLAGNDALVDGKPYTALAHAWDEGFGYFGAAQNYGAFTDEDLVNQSYRDADGDGRIDFLTEYNFGSAKNAGKRDLGATAATDFTADAWDAFRIGRAIIAQAEGALTDEQMTALRAQRDLALGTWEKVIAADTVHYINEVLQDMAAFGTEDYSFANHTKHWAEMKGFALSFQFNRLSPMGDAAFARLHEIFGQAPVLANANLEDIAAYRQALHGEAKGIIQQAYGFDPANMGDANGEGGW